MANGTIQLRMDEFLGINQTRGEQMDMRYATWAENIDTRNGQIKTSNGFHKHFIGTPLWKVEDGNNVNYSFDPVKSIFQIRLRHAEQKTLLLATTLYAVYVYDEDEVPYPWQQMVSAGQDVKFGTWSFINYEGINPETENNDLMDAVFASSQQHTIILYLKDGKFDNTVVPDVPANFGAVAQYNERIFGTAALNEPDRIWYSAPFNAEDWSLNEEIPEDGAGFIDYPTWDGDSFIALVPFGADLLAFKHNSLCVISGTYPGEYTIYKTFGTDGPVAKDTICVYRNMVFFLTTNGIGVYDGSSIRTISRDAINHITRQLAVNNTEVAKAVIHDGVYMCAVNLQFTNDDYPDAVIEYDIERGTYMLRTGFSVSAWCNFKDELLGDTILLCENDYKRLSYLYLYGHVDTYDGVPIHSVWESPFTDAGHKESIKSAFRVYTLVEDIIAEHDENSPSDPGIDFTIETERKSKTKRLKAQDDDLENKKMLSKPISNKGRQFKWKIESDTPFRIQTGIQIQAELDSQ